MLAVCSLEMAISKTQLRAFHADMKALKVRFSYAQTNPLCSNVQAT